MSHPSSEPITGASAEPWRNTTHDWAASVDADHLADVRARADELAPGGLTHLLLEVLAYADDEAKSAGRIGRCIVTFHADGSVSVADDGRGTDTRVDASGRTVRKPVMATRDLRFFDVVDPPLLPDGQARRGMSVVAALSETLVHLNRRLEGSWTQTYARGVPVTDLVPVSEGTGTAGTGAAGTTGTTVRFRPAGGLHRGDVAELAAGSARQLGPWLHLHVVVEHETKDGSTGESTGDTNDDTADDTGHDTRQDTGRSRAATPWGAPAEDCS